MIMTQKTSNHPELKKTIAFFGRHHEHLTEIVPALPVPYVCKENISDEKE